MHSVCPFWKNRCKAAIVRGNEATSSMSWPFFHGFLLHRRRAVAMMVSRLRGQGRGQERQGQGQAPDGGEGWKRECSMLLDDARDSQQDAESSRFGRSTLRHDARHYELQRGEGDGVTGPHFCGNDRGDGQISRFGSSTLMGERTPQNRDGKDRMSGTA